MKQDIARNMNGISTLAVSAIDGLNKNGVAVGVKHVTEAVLTATRTLAMAASLLFDSGKQLLRDKRDALEAAIDAGRAFATLARDILKPILGSEYNERWDVAGFNGSLAIPTTLEDLLPMLEKLVSYFTDNPGHEIAVRDVTAAQAQLIYDAVKGAFNQVAEQEMTLKVLRNDRNAKFDILRNKLVMLTDELSLLLDPLDPRWTAFGFNMPGADETPDAVGTVVATLIGPTAVALKWETTARAVYYHVWKRVQGVDEDYILVGSPADLDFTIENLPSGKQIDIVVSAVNNGGEGQRSEAVTILTN